jgi:hypothetical protein
MAYGCKITWTANPEPNIVGYRVYCGAASGIYDEVNSPRNTTLTTMVYLVPSAGTWYLAVAAVDSGGNEGGLSQEVAIDADASVAPFSAPVLSVT